MSYTIQASNGKTYVAADLEVMRQWITDGRVTRETMVQLDGGEWRRADTYPELYAADVPPVVPKRHSSITGSSASRYYERQASRRSAASLST